MAGATAVGGGVLIVVTELESDLLYEVLVELDVESVTIGSVANADNDINITKSTKIGNFLNIITPVVYMSI
jgi:hypothetical protein